MNAGDAFRLTRQAVDEHLWFVLSDPSINPDRVVIASFTSWKPRKDQACIVEAGDHPFVRHKTCVSYEDAKIVSVAFLNERLSAGDLRSCDPLSPALLKRVRTCAALSRRMKTEAWQVLEEQQDSDTY